MGAMSHEVNLTIPYEKDACMCAARVALEMLGHKVKSDNDILGTIQANVKAGLMSTTWGDTLTIVVSETSEGCQVTVNSTTKVASLMAGQQQTKNVQQFSDAFGAELSHYPPKVVTASPAPSNVAAEIKQYKELLDCGAITQEEFDQKKKQLLGL